MMPMLNGSSDKRDEICSQLFNLCLTPNDSFKFEPGFTQIYGLLEKIIDLEKDIPFCAAANKRDETSFKEFEKFLLENKCDDVKDRFSIDYFDDSEGYGVKAKTCFQKGDVLFRVPNSIILSLSDVEKSELKELVRNDRLLSAMPNVCLALLLLYLKSSKSKKKQQVKWQPYLNILPADFSTPLYFGLDEIKLLQGSQCFNDVLLHIRSIVRQYAYLVKVLKSQSGMQDLKENFSYMNYRWAVSAVSTRQNQIVDDMNNPTLALIPFLDMCNHDSQTQEFSTDFDDENKSAVCLTTKDLEIGDEVKIFYGRRSNAEMLIHNGFVPETNKFDSFKLKLSLSPHDSMNQQKTSVLKRFGLNSAETFVLKPNDEISSAVYFFIHVFITKSESEIDKMVKFEPIDLEAFSSANNLRSSEDVKKFLKTRLSLLLSSLERAQKSQNQTVDEKTNGNGCVLLNGNANGNHVTNYSSSSSLNRLFIKRLIEHEIFSLNCFIGVLNK